ncbi:MAG: sigma-70 family RNA polymerase sigma factor [Rubricoccaceae bacterium]
MTADALVRQHADLVFRVARRVTGNDADAADAAQDALVRVWRKGMSIPEERQRAWCARVSRNSALDLLRRRSVRPAPVYGEWVEPADASAQTDQHTESNEIRSRIELALTQLDEPYRSIVVLREIEGLAYAEIADTLELPLNTLKVYLHRARKQLRDAIRRSTPELVP